MGRAVGFRFRRSVRVLPGIRLNLSKSGASVSLGGRGFHYTIGSKGTRTTVGLPGTGLSWTEYRPHTGRSSARSPQRNSYISPAVQRPIRGDIFETEPTLTPIESKTANEINALSTSELAPILDRAHRRFRLSIPILIGSFGLFVFSISSEIQELVGISALYFSIFVPVAIFLDRYRRSVKVSLKLNSAARTITEVLSESISEFRSCDKVWSIRAQAQTSDWKRNAGATTLNHRARIWPRLARPDSMRGKILVPAIKLGTVELFFLPDSALVAARNSVAALNYRDLVFSNTETTFIESDRLPRDALVVGQTWRFVNKNGGPDRRFNFNRQLPVCRYGEMDFGSQGGLSGRIQYSNISKGAKLAKAVEILIKHASSSSNLNPIASYEQAKTWPTIVFLCCALLIGGILASAGMLLAPGRVFSSVPVQTTNGDSQGSNANPASKSGPAVAAPLADRKIRKGNSVTAPLSILPPLSGRQVPETSAQSYDQFQANEPTGPSKY